MRIDVAIAEAMEARRRAAVKLCRAILENPQWLREDGGIAPAFDIAEREYSMAREILAKRRHLRRQLMKAGLYG